MQNQGGSTDATASPVSKRYGAVFCAQMGSHLAVFLNDFDSINEAFKRADDAFSGRPRIAMFEMLRGEEGKILKLFVALQEVCHLLFGF